jgi:hypothetical protein
MRRAEARIAAFYRSFLPDSRYRRFHPVYLLKFIQKYLILYLLPLVRALLIWDWAAFWLALRQSAVLLLAAALLAALEWRSGGWFCDADGTLHLRRGLLRRQHLVVRGEALAAVRTDRALYHRAMGAGVLTLYYAQAQKPGTLTLYLTRRDCEQLAARLMPADGAPFYRAVGGERLSLTLLGVDTVTTGLFLWAALRQTEDFGRWAEQIALTGLGRVAAAAATWLPVGTAWLLTAAAALLFFSVGRSVFHTMNYSVYKSDDVILSSGGFLHLSSCRVRVSAITACDIRATPTARLLRRYPVYLTAGSYTGGELPVFLYRAGHDAQLHALLPLAVPPKKQFVDTKGRSLVAFLWLPACLSGLLLLLAMLAVRLLPDLAAAFFLAALGFLLMLGVGLEGFRRETVNRAGTVLAVCTVRFYTLHYWSIFGDVPQTVFSQSVWAYAVRRGSLMLCLPCGVRIRVKSIPEAEAEPAKKNAK